jgi:hypothetical protein
LKTNFYINNQQIREPNNWAELGIELNYDKDEPNALVSINNWQLGVGINDNKDSAKKGLAHINGGLSGGVGVFEGAPFRIELEDAGQVLDLFKGYLDFSTAQIDCEVINVDAIEEGGVDWLNSVADSVSFEYLYDNGDITDSDFVTVPYVINSIPKTGEAFMLTLTAFVVVKTIQDEIQALQEMTVETSNPISAIGGVLKIALRVIYIASLLLTVIKLIRDAINLIIQPVKYHNGMYIKTLLEKGCKHFGLTFKSSIFQLAPFKNAIIIPSQYQVAEQDSGVLGFLKPQDAAGGYYNGTFGDLLRTLKTMFNAKVVLENGVLTFERRDFNPTSAVYRLPNIERDGYRLNASDLLSNIFIDFSIDFNDKNTIQDYLGTGCQIITQPITSLNKRMVLSKGYSRRSLPFALAKRKTTLTVPEKIIKALAKVFDPIVGALVKIINAVIKVVNAVIQAIKKIINALNKLPKVNINFNPKPIKTIKYTPLGELIDNRIDMMMLENDFIGVPKILLADVKSDGRYTKLSSNNESVLNAKYLWDNYHFIDSFDPTVYPKTNQYKIYEVDNVPFCFDDYLKVRKNNRIFDGEKEGVIDGLSWNIYQQTANIKYRINEIYTRNFQSKIVISSKSSNGI